jgi:hypothetical protein
MNFLYIAVAVTVAVVYFKGPASQEEIAMNNLTKAQQAIEDGNMLKACLRLTSAKEAFNKVQTSEAKDMAVRLQPALNKTCNS